MYSFYQTYIAVQFGGVGEIFGEDLEFVDVVGAREGLFAQVVGVGVVEAFGDLGAVF